MRLIARKILPRAQLSPQGRFASIKHSPQNKNKKKQNRTGLRHVYRQVSCRPPPTQDQQHRSVRLSGSAACPTFLCRPFLEKQPKGAYISSIYQDLITSHHDHTKDHSNTTCTYSIIVGHHRALPQHTWRLGPRIRGGERPPHRRLRRQGLRGPRSGLRSGNLWSFGFRCCRLRGLRRWLGRRLLFFDGRLEGGKRNQKQQQQRPEMSSTHSACRP